MCQSFEFIGACHEVGLTVNFDQCPDTPSGVNIGLNQSLSGGTVDFFLCLEQSLFL